MPCSFDKKPSKGHVCQVNVSDFKPCITENGYGYNQSAPCIFMKLNRIYDWMPEFYNDTETLPMEMPADLKQHIKDLKPEQRNQVWVSCGPEWPADSEAIGSIAYYPSRGFPGYFYPYINIPGYLSPLLAIKLERPDRKSWHTGLG